jgi:hypothetical protein
VSEQQQDVRSRAGLRLHYRGTHLRKGTEDQILRTQVTIHSERGLETHTSEIFQDSRSRREEISRSPQHATPSTERRRPWQ